MTDKIEKAFAHFEAIRDAFAAERSVIEDLKTKVAGATDLTTVSAELMDLDAKHNDLHAKTLAAWEDFCEEEGIVEEAQTSNRSGGENKPPKGDPEPGEGEG